MKKIFFLVILIFFLITTNCYAANINTTESTALQTTSGVQIVTTYGGSAPEEVTVKKSILYLMLQMLDNN